VKIRGQGSTIIVMDQIDYFLTILRERFGHFTVIQNPSTGVAWPAETFIKLVAPILWQEEHQLGLFFSGVTMANLRYRDDAKGVFTKMAEDKGIFLNRERPSHNFIVVGPWTKYF
jgi:hypothetical protein